MRRRGVIVVAAGLVGTFWLNQPGASANTPEVKPPESLCIYNAKGAVTGELTPSQGMRKPDFQRRLKYEQAWTYSRGAGVSVAVVDTGVEGSPQTHMQGRVLTGWDNTTGKRTTGGNTDCFGHGTGVASLIAGGASKDNALVGIAPDAVLVPVRESWGVDADGGTPQDNELNLIDAMQTAIDAKAPIINVSVTISDCTVQSRPDLKQGFLNVLKSAEQHGVLIVAASGNVDDKSLQNGTSCGTGNQQVVWPAAMAGLSGNVMAVGGIDPSDALYQKSLYGTINKKNYVSVVAPAVQIMIAMPHGGVKVEDGTSFATPMVAGTAALIKSRFPKMSPSEIKNRIEQTADHPSSRMPDLKIGYGIVNPVAALTAYVPNTVTVPAGHAAPPIPAPTPPDTHTRNIVLAAVGGGLLVTLGVVTAAVVVPRGRRRRWQPGDTPLTTY